MPRFRLSPEVTAVARSGLWFENQATVALLGLCPLLAVSTSLAVGLGLGGATMLVLTLSNGAVSALRGVTPRAIRLPVFVLTISGVVTLVEMILRVSAPAFYQSVGLFIPLIVTNCVVLARAEAYAYRQPVRLALWDGCFMGLGFAAVLLVLGAFREILGRGTLFYQFELLLGPVAKTWVINLFTGYQTVPVLLQAPGAFLGLACLIAIKNAWERRRSAARIGGG